MSSTKDTSSLRSKIQPALTQLSKGPSPCCSLLGVLARAVTSQCASGHSGSQDHRQHPLTLGHPGLGSMLGLTFHPAVCSPHKVVSVHVSISGCPGLHATGQGTARASMFPTQDLGMLIWLRATRRGRRVWELHQGGRSHPRLWSRTGQLIGAFLFFKS